MDNIDNTKRTKKSDKSKKTWEKYGTNTTKGARIKQDNKKLHTKSQKNNLKIHIYFFIIYIFHFIFHIFIIP